MCVEFRSRCTPVTAFKRSVQHGRIKSRAHIRVLLSTPPVRKIIRAHACSFFFFQGPGEEFAYNLLERCSKNVRFSNFFFFIIYYS